ncbi:Uncharacterized protein TCM_043724 [Theobroma cacao]|uniref:Uncharacterized protein n=1 Tax=Theobroma cacao TaxID=3641 RepID=A0A061FQW6_THECC|nr:Uncharacterized protein TCM_043724 [Theobroma cacao]
MNIKYSYYFNSKYYVHGYLEVKKFHSGFALVLSILNVQVVYLAVLFATKGKSCLLTRPNNKQNSEFLFYFLMIDSLSSSSCHGCFCPFPSMSWK